MNKKCRESIRCLITEKTGTDLNGPGKTNMWTFMTKEK